MIRYDSATHLLEQVTGLRYIQKLLGGITVRKTTKIHIRVSKKVIDNIKNPADDFFE